MQETIISCPKCNHSFKLEEVLRKEIEENIISKVESEYKKELKKEEQAKLDLEKKLLDVTHSLSKIQSENTLLAERIKVQTEQQLRKEFDLEMQKMNAEKELIYKQREESFKAQANSIAKNRFEAEKNKSLREMMVKNEEERNLAELKHQQEAKE
jgi:hypothetical protein